jgi:hypothetical protein
MHKTNTLLTLSYVITHKKDPKAKNMNIHFQFVVKPKNTLPLQLWRILDVEKREGDIIHTEFCAGPQCAIPSAHVRLEQQGMASFEYHKEVEEILKENSDQLCPCEAVLLHTSGNISNMSADFEKHFCDIQDVKKLEMNHTAFYVILNANKLEICWTISVL